MRRVLVLALGALTVSACAPPDEPSPIDADLPDAGAADLGAPDAAPSPAAYPGPGDVEEDPELPDLFEGFDGTRVASTPEAWTTWRRDELIDLFSHYVYGYDPGPVPVSGREVARADLLDGTVRYVEWELTLGELPTTLHLALFSPVGVDSPPVFLGLNKCGNQSVLDDTSIRATTSWFDADGCGGADVELTRASRASYWPVADITSRGYALAIVHESDLDPDTNDDDDFSDGVHPHVSPSGRPAETAWGRIGAWSWGMSHAIDFLIESNEIDTNKIATVGHSRRGKTSLWTGARDTRVALVIAHQSGTGGTALTRSLEGESLLAINTFFPHWFNDVFPTFARVPLRMPVDQHQLVALVAPRLMLATDGSEDLWADPMGSRASILAASPAWELLGVDGVVLGEDDEPSALGRLRWQSRPGDHVMGPDDWALFMDFADAHWRE